MSLCRFLVSCLSPPGDNSASLIKHGQSALALQHEIGHVTEILARRMAVGTKFENFDDALSKVLKELESKGGLIRPHAKSKPGKAWAEAYSSYVCSEESKKFIEENLPFTYEFLVAVLPNPVWLDN